MTDHERFLVLASRQLSEGLSREEEAELDAHLATCRSCRALTAGMRRDDILLRGQLGAVAVAPRVRQRVMQEASGKRRVDRRVVLALAATLLLTSMGVFIVGGRPPAVPPPSVASVASPTTSPSASTAVASPSVEASPSASLVPTLSAPPTPSPGSGPFVAAHYTYGEPDPRRDTIFATDPENPTGEWTRTQPPIGGRVFAGPVTCLVIDGSDAWLAGPADTVPPDRSHVVAAFMRVHDGGPNGDGDRAILWLNNPGETLTLLEGWCRTRFTPGGPFPLSSGDVVVDDGNP